MNKKDKEAIAQQQREVAQLADFNYGHQESSAAVRGEVVAESDLTTIKCPSCNGHGLIGGHSGQTPESYEEHAEGCDDCDGQGKIIVSKSDLAAFVSARAADAPSEPSEHRFNSLGISENWSVTVEANGESILCISDQHVAGIAEPELDAMVPTIESAALHLLGFIGKSRAADAPSEPSDKVMEKQAARDAIDGAIQSGREGYNKPSSTDHWLHEYWSIGQQLARLGETGWDNVTPIERAADAPFEPSKPTELSHRLRETADQQPGWKPLLTAAADEIERYYGGMMAWKRTAEQKDADWCAKSRAADALDSQPTVAAQQGSIGEDAQFRMLAFKLTNAVHEHRSAEIIGAAHKALVAYIDSRAPAAPVAPIAPDGWISADKRLPEVRMNDYDEFIVLCKRNNGKKYVFSAYYLNNKLLQSRWPDEDEPEEGLPLSGWHFESEVDGDNVFSQVCEPGDVVTHWQPLPPAPQQEGSEAGNG